MGRFLCRWFGHQWVGKYEPDHSVSPSIALVPMPFGFEWRLFPIIVPRARLIGVTCHRCRAEGGKP